MLRPAPEASLAGCISSIRADYPIRDGEQLGVPFLSKIVNYGFHLRHFPRMYQQHWLHATSYRNLPEDQPVCNQDASKGDQNATGHLILFRARNRSLSRVLASFLWLSAP